MAMIYACPAEKRLLCSWEGYASDIKQHFEKEHNGLLFHTNSVEIDLNILPENRLLYLQGEIYLVQSYIQDNKLFLRLRYLGPAAVASKKLYDIIVDVNRNLYKYETERINQIVLPSQQGWEINLKTLKDIHGEAESISCTFLIQDIDNAQNRERKESSASFKNHNNLIDNELCDELETQYLDAIRLVDNKINHLQENQDGEDIMDSISQLNFSILEEPFMTCRKSSVDENKVKQEEDNVLPISDEAKLLCSSCRNDMLPPIYLCLNGHNVCIYCKTQNCKVCGERITEFRNTDLENISRTYRHNCKYELNGCNEKLFYNEIRGHEAKCQFCGYKCLINGCNSALTFENFITHLKIMHHSIKIKYSMSSEFPKNTEFFMVDKAKGIFYCKSEQNGEAISWDVVFCGPRERQFFCELYFKGSKAKEPIFFKKQEQIYTLQKLESELKKLKAKEKYAILTITSYDA